MHDLYFNRLGEVVVLNNTVITNVLSALDYNSVVVLALLIMLDTILGIAASIKLGVGIDSGIGRHGLMSKAVEVLVCITFNALSLLAPELIPSLLAAGIYAFFILFELTSIVENLGLLGYEIPVLTQYLKVLKDNNKTLDVDLAKSNKAIYKDTQSKGGKEDE